MNLLRNMKLLRNLLIIAATGLGTSAQALAQTDLGILSPTVQQTTTSVYSTGTTFADIYNFTIGAEYQTLLSSAVGYQPEGTTAEQTSVSNLTLALYDSGGAQIGSSVYSSNGSMIDLSSALVSGDYSLTVSGTANGSVGGAYQISVAAVPEPAGWAMLLSGLAVVTFLARRKTSLASLMAG